ncbi:MAG: NADH-ubiquinone oxidoreductase-F iron-sulfur binding region domain-containing protein [Halobacteriales archaeon]
MATESPGDTVCRIASGSGAGELDMAMREATDAPIRSVGSTGARALEPLLSISRGGRTAFFAACTESRAAEVARDLDGDLPTQAAEAVVSHEEESGTLPIPDLSALSVGTRSVLGRCGWVRPTHSGDYRASGGFGALSADSVKLRDAARDIAGRGWGDAATDEPIGETWDRVVDAGGDPAVVVNGHGSPGDRLLLESVPFLPLEGALGAARAVDATEVVVYLSAGDGLVQERVTAAVESLPDDERLGAIDVRVATGTDEHRAAEPTMALEAIEGTDRLEARLRPPGPEAEGLHGRPTLVHTPRTLAQVVRAVEGAEGTRVVTVRGDETATIELPEGASLSVAREAVGLDGSFKGARVGGRFGGLTPDLDIPASADALDAAGLGTEGVIDLLGDGECVVAHVGETARYAEAENCGRCVPCREGSKQLTELLREVYEGSFRRGDIEELLRVVRSSSLCAFGPHMTRPIATAIEHFEDEFVEHAEGRCPAGSCTTDVPPEVAA